MTEAQAKYLFVTICKCAAMFVMSDKFNIDPKEQFEKLEKEFIQKMIE